MSKHTLLERNVLALEVYMADDLEYHELLRERYENKPALEGSILETIKDSAVAILEKCIELLKKLLSYFVNFIQGFGGRVSSLAMKLKSIPSRKKRMIALKIKNIDIQVAAIKANTEMSKEEAQARIDELLSQKSKLEEENKFLAQNYIVAEEHFDLIRRIDNTADVSLRTLVSTHSSFAFELEKFDYIPNMFNIAQMNNDNDLYNSIKNSKSNSYNAGVMAGTGLVTGAQSVLGSTRKVYDDNDTEFREYMDVIDKYMNGEWNRTITNSMTTIESLTTKINEIKNRTQLYSKVKVIKITDFDKLLDKYTAKTKDEMNIQRTISKYQAILEKNYREKGPALKKKILFFKPKAPQYLLNIIAILKLMSESYIKLRSYKSAALLTMLT